MNAWKVILAALVIYGAGIVTGSFGVKLNSERPPSRRGGPRPPMMHDLVQRMESRLNLSTEQRERVLSIVEASQGRMQILMDEVRPKFETESQSMRLEIEATLNEEQMAAFDRIFEHRGKRPSRGGPGGFRGEGRREGRGEGRSEGRGEGRFDRGMRNPSPGERRDNRHPERPQRPEMDDASEQPGEITDAPSVE